MIRKKFGHELDRIAEQYESISCIVIYGMGEYGHKVAEMIRQLHLDNQYKIIFTDKKSHQNPGYVSPEWLLQYENKQSTLVVIAIADANAYNRMNLVLQKRGYSKNNICGYDEFTSLILPVMAAYYADKLFLYTVQVSIGDKCNLNCQDCTNFIPYMNNKKNRETGEILRDLDILFNKVDYIWHLPIIGGETFLHNDLLIILRYILEKYSNQVGQLWIYTNGTLPQRLDDEMCKLLVEYTAKIQFFVSNYTHKNPELKKNYDRFLDILEQQKIIYTYIENFIWNDTGVRNRLLVKHENIEEFVTLCSQPCRDYENGQLYYCAIAKYAGKAFDIDDQKNCIDIANSSRKEIVEYMLGYIDQGYLDVCKICNGYDEFTNDKVVDAGVQKGKM